MARITFLPRAGRKIKETFEGAIREAKAGILATGKPLLGPRTPFEAFAGQARERIAPLLKRLGEREAFLRPRAAEAAFAPEAERGFGLSGIARETVQSALADLATRFESTRGEAITSAMRDLAQEQEQRRGEEFREKTFAAEQRLGEQQLGLQRQAAKRRKFLGIF